MNTPVETKQDKSSEQVNTSRSDFNFELWARQVRPQLIASVQKRGMK